MSRKLGTIEQEAAACRERFKGVKVGTLVRCLHHEILCEILHEIPEIRIAYILDAKPEHERARRLYEMRPVPDDGSPEYDAYDKARATYVKARAACVKAWDACVKARAAYDKARAAYDKARAAYDKAWDAYISTHRQQIIDMVPDTSWDGERLQFGEEINE